MKTSSKIIEVVVKVGKKELKLSPDECKELRDELNKVVLDTAFVPYFREINPQTYYPSPGWTYSGTSTGDVLKMENEALN